MKRLIVFFLCLACALWCVSSCKKKGDPCPPEVDFEMYYMYKYWPNQDASKVEDAAYEKIICDTVLNSTVVVFEARESGAIEYEWVISGETNPILERKFDLYFNISNLTSPRIIPVTLTAKFSPEGNCRNYPNNKKVITRNLCVMPNKMQAYLGKFRGYDTKNPSLKYDINIYTHAADPYGFIIDGLATPIYFTYEMSGYGGYRHFALWSRYTSETLVPCKAKTKRETPWGFCGVDNSNNRITITYYMENYPNCTTNVVTNTNTFIGERIP